MSVALTKPSAKEPEILIDYEVQTLLSKLQFLYARDYMMIDLALSTGLRNDEICSLKIECILCFEIVPTILQLPGAIAKGGFPRDIPLNEDIRGHLTRFIAWKTQHDEDISPGAYLFLSKFGKKRLSPRDFQRMLNTISQKSIGRPIHPHVLRHTFATRLLKVSNLPIVQKVLGHKNIQTTQIYTHPSNDDISLAMEKL